MRGVLRGVVCVGLCCVLCAARCLLCVVCVCCVCVVCVVCVVRVACVVCVFVVCVVCVVVCRGVCGVSWCVVVCRGVSCVCLCICVSVCVCVYDIGIYWYVACCISRDIEKNILSLLLRYRFSYIFINIIISNSNNIKNIFQ